MLTFSASLASGQSQPAPQDDRQFWNDTQVSVPITRKVDFVLLGTLRLGSNVNRFADERIGVAFSLKFGKYLTIAPSYLHITTQPTKNISPYENRLSFPATVRFLIGSFTLSDRNLFERRLRHPSGASTRYRNKLQLDHPVGPKKAGVNLLLADEVFYDWSVNRWVRNRISIGVSKIFDKHFTGELYYLRQNDGRSRPGDLHVVGTTLRFKI